MKTISTNSFIWLNLFGLLDRVSYLWCSPNLTSIGTYQGVVLFAFLMNLANHGTIMCNFFTDLLAFLSLTSFFSRPLLIPLKLNRLASSRISRDGTMENAGKHKVITSKERNSKIQFRIYFIAFAK